MVRESEQNFKKNKGFIKESTYRDMDKELLSYDEGDREKKSDRHAAGLFSQQICNKYFYIQ